MEFFIAMFRIMFVVVYRPQILQGHEVWRLDSRILRKPHDVVYLEILPILPVVVRL
jgi:hypothetical protein